MATPKTAAKTTLLTVGGFDITVQRKRIKNMYLRVLAPDGQIRLSAPLKTSTAYLARFVRANAAWLTAKQQEMANRPKKEILTYSTGEQVNVWGELHKLVVQEGDRTAVFRRGGELVLLTPTGSTSDGREAALNEWYRSELWRALPPVLARAEQIVGQRAAEYRLKNMKTRWGTCNVARRRVWLNLKLAEKPLPCLEYVVIHELTHLWEPSHNARFKALMNRFCPDWRTRKKVLNGQLSNIYARER